METKQVIVVRKDLGMRKGKMIAQGAHASMKVFFDLGKVIMCAGSAIETHWKMEIGPLTLPMREWVEGSFGKVVVGCNSEQELLDLHRQALQANLPCAIIQDQGRTEFHGVPTYTALAIGPARVEDIDTITGELKLL